MLLAKYGCVPPLRKARLRDRLLAGAALIAAVTPAGADDATWTGTTNNYFSASNWSTGAAPSGTASFAAAPVTTIQITAPAAVGAWSFAAGAPAYTFNGNNTVQFNGAGILGSANLTNNTTLQFANTSSAGTATITNNHLINFTNNSTAGTATITNNSGGQTYFSGNASGGSARLIANGAGLVDFSQLASGTTVGSIAGSGSFLLGSKSITVGANDLSTTVSGFIKDGGIAGGTGGALTKTGAGTLTLSAANTYTGGTTVTGGLINFNAVNNFGTGSITLNGGGLQWAAGGAADVSSRLAPIGGNGATFDTNGNNVSFATGLAGTGGVTKTGVGTLKLNTGNSYSGATTINGGTLLGGVAHAFSAGSATTVNDGGTLDLGGFAQTVNAVSLAGGTIRNGQLSGAITSTGGTVEALGGTASLTATTGTTTLQGSNAYSGATIVDGGTVIGSNANAFSAGSATTVNAGGTLDLGGFGHAINAVSLAGGTIIMGDLTGSIASSGGTLNTIGGGASLTTTSGSTTLYGSNTYSGATTVNGGTLLGGNANAFSAGSATAVNTGGTLDLGGFAQTINTVSLAGGTVRNGQLSGAITSSGGTVEALGGSASLTATTGTTTLQGTNSYSGTTLVNGGTLLGGSANAFSAGSATTVNAGGTLDLGGFAQTINAVSLAGGTVRNGQLSGAITSTGGTLSTLGGAASLTTTSGTTTLQGANSFTGSTTVNGGTLLGGSANAFSAGSATTVNAGGTLDLGGFAQSIDTLSLKGGTVRNGQLAGAITSTGGTLNALGGAASLTTTSGTTTLQGANSFTGATTVNGGTLLGGNANAFSAGSATTVNSGGTLDLGGFGQTIDALSLAGGMVRNGQLSGAITSSGGTLNMLGGAASLTTISGTTTLQGTNGFTGATTVNGGTLVGGNANAFSATSLTTVNSGGTLDLGGFGQTINALALAGGTVRNGQLTGAITSTGGTLNTLGGAASLVASSGTTTLSGTNSYAGATTVTGGTLLGGNPSAFSAGSLTTINGGGTLDLGGFAQTINAVSLSGGAVRNGQLTGAITSAGGTIEALGGSASLTTTSGTTTVRGVNSYSGLSLLNGGTLVVEGTATNSAITVNSGALLTGAGTVGTATVASGGLFAPGAPGTIGAMTVTGNLAFQSGALYLVQVDPANASIAQVTASTATLGGTVLATFKPGSYIARQYMILSAGSLAGTFNGLTTSNLPSGFNANLSYGPTDVFLNLTAVLGTPRQALGPGGLATNPQNIANAINGYFNTGGALPANFLALYGLSGSNLVNGLAQLGEAATGAPQGAFHLTDLFLALMLDPLVYGGASGVSDPFGAGGPLQVYADAERLPDRALAYAKGPNAATGPLPAPGAERRWNVWAGGYGGTATTKGDSTGVGSHDLSTSVAGSAAGVDYRLWPGTTVGFAVGGGSTSWSVASGLDGGKAVVSGLGGGTSDVFQAGLYGATRWGPAYLASAVSFAEHWMVTDRMAFGNDHLTARFNAQNYAARVESGWRFGTDFGGVAPYFALQAQSFRMPSYNETDVTGGGFGLNFDRRAANDARSELGARFDTAMPVADMGVLTFKARAAWAHDWISDAAVTATFQNLPGAGFVIYGAMPGGNSALLTAGSELRLLNGWAVAARFDGEFASNTQSYAGTGTLRYAW